LARTRTHQDRCGVARALDVVGERWALLVVRELLLGPKRFTDLRRGLPKVSAEVLAQRLRDLEQAGVVDLETLPGLGAVRAYRLTPRGAALEPVVLALGRWGSELPLPTGPTSMSEDSYLLALKTLFHACPEDTRSWRLGLDHAGQRFQLEVDSSGLQVKRSLANEPDVRFVGHPRVLLDLAQQRCELDDVLERGEAEVSGDVAILRSFLSRFRPSHQELPPTS
jgi:DNA-binding HxlR family transcriptional regulator